MYAAAIAAISLSTGVAAAQKPKPAPKVEEPKDPPKTEAAATDAKPEDPNAKKDGPENAQGGNVEPPHDAWDPKNVEELPGKTYLFVGLRYRGTIVPKITSHWTRACCGMPGPPSPWALASRRPA